VVAQAQQFLLAQSPASSAGGSSGPGGPSMTNSQTFFHLGSHHNQLQQIQLQHHQVQHQLQHQLQWQHHNQHSYHSILQDMSELGRSVEKGHVNSVSCTPPLSTTTKSYASGLSLDGSVATGQRPQGSVGKKKCTGKPDENGGKCTAVGRCHCSKRRWVVLALLAYVDRCILLFVCLFVFLNWFL
jgi:hypothetical protein